MSDVPDLGQGGLLGALGTFLGIITTLGYKAYRRVRTDETNDAAKAVEARAVIRDEDHTAELLKQQQDLNANLIIREAAALKRADTFAAERNFAMTQEQQVKGDVKVLQVQMAAMVEAHAKEREETARARKEAKDLTDLLGKKVDELREENSRLKVRIAQLEATLVSAGIDRPEMHAPPVKWEDPAS